MPFSFRLCFRVVERKLHKSKPNIPEELRNEDLLNGLKSAVESAVVTTVSQPQANASSIEHFSWGVAVGLWKNLFPCDPCPYEELEPKADHGIYEHKLLMELGFKIDAQNSTQGIIAILQTAYKAAALQASPKAAAACQQAMPNRPLSTSRFASLAQTSEAVKEEVILRSPLVLPISSAVNPRPQAKGPNSDLAEEKSPPDTPRHSPRSTSTLNSSLQGSSYSCLKNTTGAWIDEHGKKLPVYPRCGPWEIAWPNDIKPQEYFYLSTWKDIHDRLQSRIHISSNGSRFIIRIDSSWQSLTPWRLGRLWQAYRLLQLLQLLIVGGEAKPVPDLIAGELEDMLQAYLRDDPVAIMPRVKEYCIQDIRAALHDDPKPNFRARDSLPSHKIKQYPSPRSGKRQGDSYRPERGRRQDYWRERSRRLRDNRSRSPRRSRYCTPTQH